MGLDWIEQGLTSPREWEGKDRGGKRQRDGTWERGTEREERMEGTEG